MATQEEVTQLVDSMAELVDTVGIIVISKIDNLYAIVAGRPDDKGSSSGVAPNLLAALLQLTDKEDDDA